MPKSDDLISFDEPSVPTTPACELARLLVHCGVPAEHAGWVADLFLLERFQRPTQPHQIRTDLIPNCNRPEDWKSIQEGELPPHIEDMAMSFLVPPFTGAKTIDAALLELLVVFASHLWNVSHSVDWQQDFNEHLDFLIPRWINRLPHIDFTRAVVGIRVELGSELQWQLTLGALLRADQFDFFRLIDLELLRNSPSKQHWSHVEPVEPIRLQYWFDCSINGALRAFLPVLRRHSDPELVVAFDKSLADWIGVRHRDGHPLDFKTPTRQSFATFVEPYFKLLDERAQAADDFALVAMWWRYSLFAFGTNPGELSEETKRHLIDSVQKAWAYRRPLLDRASDPVNRDAFFNSWEHFQVDGLYVLLQFAGVWAALKVLLLAFRRINTLCVCSDLRYWPEEQMSEQPPQEWRQIPDLVATTIHTGSALDPELTSTRYEFATYCLDRLKTKSTKRSNKGNAESVPSASTTEPEWVEPSAIWRRCYILAVRELEVNPDGKGHHALWWSSKNDPDDKVKETAANVYEEVRHLKGSALPTGRSPRRVLLGAFFYLRQAHYIQLTGNLPDPDGARRTRDKEVRRSKKLEAEL